MCDGNTGSTGLSSWPRTRTLWALSPRRGGLRAHFPELPTSYPDGGLELRRVLAREFDLKVENVIAGSGSEGIMSNIIRAFLCDEDEVLTTDAAFIGFQVLARSRGVKYRTVPYRALALRSGRRWPRPSTRTPRSSIWRIPTTPPARSSPGRSSTTSTGTCRSAC